MPGKAGSRWVFEVGCYVVGEEWCSKWRMLLELWRGAAGFSDSISRGFVEVDLEAGWFGFR